MNVEFNMKQLINIALIIASIFTLVFAALSIYYGNSLILRILTQGGLCLTMLLNGVKWFIYQKQKVLGLLLWLVSGFLLYVMFYTICIGI